MAILEGADGGDRTHTSGEGNWILSPARLPVPPRRLFTRENRSNHGYFDGSCFRCYTDIYTKNGLFVQPWQNGGSKSLRLDSRFSSFFYPKLVSFVVIWVHAP
jgi:hypothetical protein